MEYSKRETWEELHWGPVRPAAGFVLKLEVVRPRTCDCWPESSRREEKL